MSFSRFDVILASCADCETKTLLKFVFMITECHFGRDDGVPQSSGVIPITTNINLMRTQQCKDECSRLKNTTNRFVNAVQVADLPYTRQCLCHINATKLITYTTCFFSKVSHSIIFYVSMYYRYFFFDIIE